MLETLFQHHNLILSKQQAAAKKRQVYIIANMKGTGRFADIHFIPVPYTVPPSHEWASKPAKAEEAKKVIIFSPSYNIDSKSQPNQLLQACV